MAMVLPTGRRGQLLALGITIFVLACIWIGAVAPVLNWFDDRAETLRRERAIARRMEALAQTFPTLRRQAEAAGAQDRQGRGVLPGTSDALAAAALQQKLDEMASAAGVRIGSQEILPSSAAGEFRTVGVRVTTNAPWKALVALLLSMARAETPMVVDELSLRGPPATSPETTLPVDASFTVTAFRDPSAASLPAAAPGAAGATSEPAADAARSAADPQ
jgi:general secretion pathway protein M